MKTVYSNDYIEFKWENNHFFHNSIQIIFDNHISVVKARNGLKWRIITANKLLSCQFMHFEEKEKRLTFTDMNFQVAIVYTKNLTNEDYDDTVFFIGIPK